ncbi:n-acetylglucosamine-1-phosphodiester alpha-n-acetylglucosaminidase [Anaeramoeba flamelloides]|uniref:N-acetylglucosamine-1-phosphodiester alpha-n-acetylglucosaminidase n=1 Tax=Anaeramoeba flamelloides TaxID=1746091 RepID=A0ABQ8Y8P2_9EUKA|nr:n-acetylglucosamine-1-phosphodiester alpha-n-acetylglucosaminidase [Anaeramoeba flamelloides]
MKPTQIILLVIVLTFSQCFHDEFKVNPAKGDQPIITVKYLNTQIKNHSTNVTGTITLLENPLLHTTFYPSPSGCPGSAPVSVSSDFYHCSLAQNAGFFNMETLACLGPLVSDGKIIQNPSTIQSSFGITKYGNYSIGYIDQSTINDNVFQNLINARIWLIRAGKSFVDESEKIEKISQNFLNERAPRTAIGFNKKGQLLLGAVNGLESANEGLNLYEFADLMIENGFYYASNLDGGGSLTTYYKDKILNTCSDHCGSTNKDYPCPSPQGTCERLVTSIVCLK